LTRKISNRVLLPLALLLSALLVVLHYWPVGY
jgi:hypothetical protein